MILLFVFSFFVFDNLQIIQISNLSNITIYFFNGFIPPGWGRVYHLQSPRLWIFHLVKI